MMAAYRLKGLGWFGSCAGIVLGFYLVSLQVAGERDKLEALNTRIRIAERDIRALETEFDTRANLQQLEKWNGDILALSAPGAGQFVLSDAQFAAIRPDAPLMPRTGEGEVRTAALVVPAIPTPTTAAAAATSTAAATATVQAAAVPAASAAPGAARRTVEVAQAVMGKAKPQKVAMLDGGLLSSSTLGDILSSARAEAGRR